MMLLPSKESYLHLYFSLLRLMGVYDQNISAGMKLLGVVTEVNQKDIVISLPGGLRGLVRASEALDFTDFGTEVVYNFLSLVNLTFSILFSAILN